MNWEFLTMIFTVIGSVGACYKFMHDDISKMQLQWKEQRKEDKETWHWLFNWSHAEIERLKEKKNN